MRQPWLSLFAAGMLWAAPARADVATLSYYRMGENDAGAMAGQAANTVAVDTVGGANLYRLGAAPVYSGETGISGSTLSVSVNGGGYSNAAPRLLVSDNWGLEAWVRAAGSASGAACIVYNGNSAANGMGIYQVNNQFNGLLGGVAFVGSATVVPGAWVHLAIVTENGKSTFYVNGRPTGSGARPNTPANGNGRFSLGIRADGAEPFRGLIDEVRLFQVLPGTFSTNDLILRQAPPMLSGPLLRVTPAWPELVLAWTGGSLEQSASVSGPWSSLTGVLSPWTNRPGKEPAFFRASSIAPPPPSTLAEATAWLERRSTQMIRDCRHRTASGITAFPPQVGGGYEAFWLRDYAYMLEGNLAAFTDQELKDACRFFVAGQRADGAMVDCIGFNGTPYYMPGYGTIGQNPVADGSQFAVDVAWYTFRRTQDTNLVVGIVGALVKGMQAVPRDSTNGLVYIRPGTPLDRASYGFTDSIGKQGDELFCSLLYVQASRQLADLLDVAGQPAEAAAWRNVRDQVAESVRSVFWDPGVGLFRAATAVCRQPDIWGSAFAVYTGVATFGQAQVIAGYFKTNYPGIIKRGQLRHLPAGMYWESTGTAAGTYQNGAFWATPIGWFVYTLDLVDPALADQTVVSLVGDFIATQDENECVNDGYANVSHYVASVALPLDGIRAMVARRGGSGAPAASSR